MMKRAGLTAGLLLLLFAGALALRLPDLALRPMHTDEAVQADKSGTLVDTLRYTYNPHEYHGPALHYLALPSMWISGGKYTECSEATFRIVPAILGALMILLLFLLRDGLGAPGTLCAGLLLACAPSMVFYNRYYIAETPLIFGTLLALAAGWRYRQKPCTAWAVWTAVGLALMYTTKETWVFSVAAAFGALVVNFLWARRAEPSLSLRTGFLRLQHSEARHWVWALLVFVFIGVLLFSAFFTNIRGPWDSIETYLAWGRRATGENPHVHPWYYFLKLLAYNRFDDHFIWSEGLILLLALIGMLAGLCHWNASGADMGFVRFLTFYTILLTTVYSVIPYKTPWCLMGFQLGFILLSGVGAVTVLGGLMRLRPKGLAGVLAGLAAVLMLAGVAHLVRQDWRANFDRRFVASQRNPYVYGHTGTNALDMAKRIEELALLTPKGRDALVVIVAPGHDYWPLPFYLRRLTHTWFTDQMPPDVARYRPAVVAFLHDPEAKTPITPPAGYETTGFFGLRVTVNFAVFAAPTVYQAWRKEIEERSKVR